MIKTAIILAGGLGTRLRSAVADLPKCMAPVEGLPFIHFVIAALQKEGVENFIFSLGYKSEAIINYVDKQYPALQKKYVVETTPLGTGGAIRAACKEVNEKNAVIVNGDTLFLADIAALSSFHEKHRAVCTIALKEMTSFDRYGAVEINSDQSIKAFKEKQFCEHGTINGGVYALTVADLLKGTYPDVFSFEKEYLEKNTGTGKLYGVINNHYFIDIGIPEDYQRFQDEYKIISAANNLANTPDDTNKFLNLLTA
ncbi:nucleotidyltransferase family protein [Ferruginibacter paludis]|uniref:nucleotidyltransferase family protein n=1 Tax=Ferruginibacter paludis TaxID=1310417 RepID=UPI0025B3C14E|nr:nucleotidyltransferase family protein [Ferruginibacter paludis]MDN3656626.1 nucleotidyltransferase family protein [Ferruginibacter paludis]